MAQEILIASKVSYSQNEKELVRNIFNKVNELVNIINTKDTAIFDGDEFFTSQQWYVGKDQGQQLMIYRKVFPNVGALPNAGRLNFPHGLALDNTWDFVKIYGVSKDPVSLFFAPLPNENIFMGLTATDIQIDTTSDWSNFTDTRVVIEYTRP